MSEAQRAWVKNVLGVDVSRMSADAPADKLAALREGLFEVGASLREIGDSTAPGVGELRALFTAAQGHFKAKEADAGLAALRDVRAKMKDVMARARGGVAAAVSEGSVARGKLLLELRAAHAAAQAGLQRLAAQVLAAPDVRGDPRLKQAEAELAKLPGKLPALDDKLAAALDAFDAAADAAARSAAARQARALAAEFGGAPPTDALRRGVQAAGQAVAAA